MKTLDRTALQQGALTALLFAVPFSLASRWLADREGGSSWAPVLWLLALAGFTLGAGIAAWLQRTGYPLLHGIVCAAGTYLVAQTVFIAVKLTRGGEVRWLSVLFTFTVVLFAGVVGGGLGSALQKRGIMPGQRGRS